MLGEIVQRSYAVQPEDMINLVSLKDIEYWLGLYPVVASKTKVTVRHLAPLSDVLNFIFNPARRFDYVGV